MSDVSTWSTTAGSNNSTPPDGWPEDQAPSTVNNCGREVMAQIATWRQKLSPGSLENVGITASVASNDLTVALKNKSGSDPSTTNKVGVAFRSTTLTAGQWSFVDFTAATSVVLPATGTLGFSNSETGYIFVYLAYDGTNKEIGLARRPLDEGILYSTTAIGTGSDAVSTLYTTSALTSAAVRLIGRLKIVHGTAVWDAAPTEVIVWQPEMSREIKGSYSGTLTDLTTTPTTTINYSIMGDIVTLSIQRNVTGTSNSTSFTISGAPAVITPANNAGVKYIAVIDNSAGAEASVRMLSTGVLQFLLGLSSTGFTSSGTKGLPNFAGSYTYKLTNPS